MAGFAAAIGGAGQAAGQYGEAQRGRMLQQWGVVQSHLADLIGKARDSATTPERQTELDALRAKVLKSRPGQDPSKLLQDVTDHLTLHPTAVSALSPQAPPSPKPGPAAPGEVPGQGTMAGLISGGAAQPSTSPVQSPSPTTPAQPTGGSSAPSSAPAAPPAAMPTPAPSPAPLGAGGQIMDAYTRAIAAGSMPQALSTAAQPFLTNTAELERTRQLDHYLMSELGPQRFQAIKSQVPNWDALPDYMKAAYAASSMGVPPVTMPGMAMMPRLMSAGTMGSQAPPGSMEYGTDKPVDPNTRYRVMTLPMTGEMMWQPETAQVGITQTPGGLQSSNLQTGQQVAPIQGAIPPVMNTPKTAPTAAGGVEQFTPAGVQGGIAPVQVPGAVAPSVMGTKTSAGTEQTETGSNTTRTVQRILPGDHGKMNQPGESPLPTHGTNGEVLGTPAFQQRVKTIADAALIPNQSESQVKTTLSTMVGPTKSPLAKAVREEMARRVAADPGPISWDMATSERAQLSQQTLSHIDEIKTLIGKLDKVGQLGPVLSRWNEFWTGTIGKDLTNNQDYVALKNNVGLLTKVMGRIHGGARGGGSIQMIESFKKDLTQERMDAPTLTRALDTEANWLKTYADPKHTAVPQSSINPVVQVFHDGGKTYHIPADKVGEFKKDHPGAQ